MQNQNQVRKWKVKSNRLLRERERLDKQLKQTQKHTRAFEFAMQRVKRARTLAGAKAAIEQVQHEVGMPTTVKGGRQPWL